MKAEHRHELKTNELAEWITNLPEWANRNMRTIIIVTVIVVLAVGSYLYFRYQRNAGVLREKLQLTELAAAVMMSKQETIVRQFSGVDFSFSLLDLAGDLRDFADRTKNDRMAALALIKRAEALRAELHYRPKTLDRSYLTKQIQEAEASYRLAIDRSLLNPPLKAMAEFGLGLCREELGDFEKAREIYRDIVKNPDYESTIVVVQARQRLETMPEFQKKIVFKPAPRPEPSPLPPPPVRPGAPDADLPIFRPRPTIPRGANLPDFGPVAPLPGPAPGEPNEKPPQAGDSDAATVNMNTIAPNPAVPESGG
ncbi:MAG: tetratricopeptide repeat protein [Planctomycetota bacterium]|jgi:tetratricopeptide (TPR) repeat protein